MMPSAEAEPAADGALIRLLMTWLSPGFPVGAYSYSHGIEHAAEAGLVVDRAALADWIETIIRFGAGRNDAIFLVATMAAVRRDDAEALVRVAGRADAFRSTAELALESRAQGEAFMGAVQAAWPHPQLSALASRLKAEGVSSVYPVAVGMAVGSFGVKPSLAVAAYLQAFAGNLVSAGVRLIPLGQTDGLRVLASLEPAVHAVAEDALAASVDDLGSATVMVDWTSARHETQYTRLFRS